jgi:octaprenyl-diphosphate synthase
MQLSDGELIQLVNARKSTITEEDYFSIIRKKTALLFASCNEVGALSVGANQTDIEHLRNFGELLGLCFQIKDDIFDYSDNLKIGKPTGNDIQDGKVTLPLIYALRNSQPEEKEKIIRLIDNDDFTPENIRMITDFAHKNGGVAYAATQMEKIKNQAIAELNHFPDSDIKASLSRCAEFVTLREK